MRGTQSPVRWPAAIILLHWVMAVALFAMLAGGMAMTRTAAQAQTTGDFGATILGVPIFEAYQLHKSVGVTLFALVVIRLGLRLTLPEPDLPAHMPRAERLAARGAQLALYVLMLGLPLSGWLVASFSTLGLPTVVFGHFELPHIFNPDATREAWAKTVHLAGASALIGIAAVHGAAALKHHFINKDNVLRAMLPGFAIRAPQEKTNEQ